MENTAKFWNKIAEKYSKKPIDDKDGYDKTIRVTRTLLRSSQRVLEIGCGTGTRALELCADVREYIATDVATEMIRIADEKLLQTKASNLTFKACDVLDASFTPGSFDVVLAYNLFHLIPDPDLYTRRIFDLLKPGGIFISKTPCLREGSRLIPIAAKVMAFFYGLKLPNGLQVKDMTECVTRNGFGIIESHEYQPKPVRIFIAAQKPVSN
ncbi:MAG: class I SAM-dependent methyltransferase [Candidatus Omnitrophica bacterium]|nr:class I SAM-dependent methyltransferase [Candidatus Omnitrophota bacterium]